MITVCHLALMASLCIIDGAWFADCYCKNWVATGKGSITLSFEDEIECGRGGTETLYATLNIPVMVVDPQMAPSN